MYYHIIESFPGGPQVDTTFVSSFVWTDPRIECIFIGYKSWVIHKRIQPDGILTISHKNVRGDIIVEAADLAKIPAKPILG